MIDWRLYALITYHYATNLIEGATYTEKCSTSPIKCSTCTQKCSTYTVKNVIGRSKIVLDKNCRDLILNIDVIYRIMVAPISVLIVICKEKNAIYIV